MAREVEELTSIVEQAAHWSLVFRDGEPSASDKREFVEWVSRSPEHVAASLSLASLRAAIARKDVRWPKVSSDELEREAKAESDENVVPIRSHALPRSREPSRLTFPLAIGLAASLLIAVCLGWFALSRPEQYQTKVGEQRSVLLADGSRVTLNTASRINVHMRRRSRVVELVQGEALFEVAHDAQRPFEVSVANAVVRAVGTQFDIDRRLAHTTVTVMEGRVAMEVDGVAKQVPLLHEGDRVVVDGAGPGPVQHGVDLSSTTAWLQRQLVFQGRPLGEIAEEFNRYNVEQIDIRSPDLRDQEVTGTFRSDDLRSFVSLLAGIPGAHVSRTEAGDYVVTFDGSAASWR